MANFKGFTPYIRVLFSTGALFLVSACSTGSGQVTEVVPPAVEVSSPVPQKVSLEETVQLWQDTCLTGFPKFLNFVRVAKGAQLKRIRKSAFPSHVPPRYHAPGKQVAVGLVPAFEERGCLFVVKSESNPRELGQAILSATKLSTKSEVKKEYASSIFEYAVQLTNGSLLTYDLNTSDRAGNYAFVLTGPVTDEQIKFLISD